MAEKADPHSRKRLDLNREVVEKAKAVYAKATSWQPKHRGEKEPGFRDVLSKAVERFLPDLADKLGEIGLHAIHQKGPKGQPTDYSQEVESRQRPVDDVIWGKLEKLGEQYDLTAVQMIRCCLELYNRAAADESKGGPSTQLETDAPRGN